MNNTTKETLDLIKVAQANPSDPLKKAGYTQSFGLTNYDLQAPAKLLYPVITPIRNMLPRVKGDGDTATRWKAITGVNINNLSLVITESNRGGVSTDRLQNMTAAYSFLGLEGSVSFEADYAAEGFDNARARAVEGVLRAVMIGEERLLLGGNATTALGTANTPTLSAGGTGGTIPTQTTSVIVVGLTMEGFGNASVANGVPGQISRVSAGPYNNTDTYGGGSSMKSAAATIGTTLGQNVTMTTAPLAGAFGYAWFWGVAGSEKLGAITSGSSYTATAPAAGAQNASAITADNSVNGLGFDGFISQTIRAGSGGYYKQFANGSTLTSDGAGGIVEIDDMLQDRWDNYRLGPDILWVNSQEIKSMTNKIIAGGGAPLYRFNMDARSDNNNIAAGAVIGSYLNKFMNESIQVRVHPNMPAGMIFAQSTSVDYPLSNVTNIAEIKYRRDYYQTDWVPTKRQYEFGVYADEVLAVYFPAAFGVISNITAG